MIFIIVSVYLFEKPAMQLIVHQALIVFTIMYISHDRYKFIDDAQRYIEISSEVLLLLTTVLIQ